MKDELGRPMTLLVKAATGTAMISDDHYSETRWAEHKKLVCREFSFPVIFDALFSDFKKDGYSVRQVLHQLA